MYHVQFTGLRIYLYNKLCEEETLHILRHYPVLSPVVFSVYTDGKLTNIRIISIGYPTTYIYYSLYIENPHKTTVEECPVNRGYIKATASRKVLPYTTSDSITINISGNVPTTQRNLVYTSWYFNGYGSLPTGTWYIQDGTLMVLAAYHLAHPCGACGDYQLASPRSWGFITPHTSTMGHLRFFCNWIIGATIDRLDVMISIGTLLVTLE